MKYFGATAVAGMLMMSLGCNFSSLQSSGRQTQDQPFREYWFQGEAELSTYSLEQARYGEMRSGEAVFIFVTEDFSKSKQVKLDRPDQAGKDKIPVMKWNAVRRFTTGIYDYSVMQSVFTPLNDGQYPHTLKATCTVQDWCGQTFTQYNRRNNGYRFRQFSYFEEEGDLDQQLDGEWLEDELWNRIRLQPNHFPTGTVSLVPGTIFGRFRHKMPVATPAVIRMEQSSEGRVLYVEYTQIKRRLVIRYEPVFPFRILEWEETDGDDLVTKGKLQKTIKSPYWQQNGNQFNSLRDTLRLMY